MHHTDPDQAVADARARLVDANRRLTIDITDALALTNRDEALADLERASQDRQRLARHELVEDPPYAWLFWMLVVVALIAVAWGLVFFAGVAVGRWTV